MVDLAQQTLFFFDRLTKPVLQILPLSEINTAPDVAGELAVREEARHAVIEKPAILPIRFAQAIFQLKRLSPVEGLYIRLQAPVEVLRMHAVRPAVPPFLLQRPAGIVQ